MKSIRREIMLFLVAVVIVGVAGHAMADNTTEYHARADAAIQAFLLDFWDQNSSYIRATSPYKGNVTQYWDFAQGFDALIDAVERTKTLQYYGWLNTFYNAQNTIGWFRNYYDDENWMAMALLRAYDLALSVHDTISAANYMKTSTTLLLDISKAWDTTCCGKLKGGIWWDKPHTQKATAANAGPVILAARMYQRTNNTQYLNWAEEWFSFWSTNMVAPSYEIADHFTPRGQVLWWKFTYNSGLMIGAATELYKSTNDPKYLALAHDYASFLITNMTVASKYGPVLTDGSSAQCGGDCEEFKGPGYRYLMELYRTDPTNSKNEFSVLQACAQAIWYIARDPTRNLFSVDWVETLNSSVVVSDEQQNVASMALSLWAESYGPYPGTGYPYGQYEAENGQIVSLGVEAKYTGFTGWGYVAGYGNNGESVSIYFQLNTTSYSIKFRYATGSNAERTISLDGQIIVPKFAFPSTGGYQNYNYVSTESLNGTPGWHTLTISFISSQGSTGFVNLDNLQISD